MFITDDRRPVAINHALLSTATVAAAAANHCSCIHLP